ncbi:hypothetical protein GWI33_000690 [Rhynchophorus ferrugineus]|uniref:Uncharacterized protein n=1 Tax=Rhynchophorus ferrugineus TaxID=354439 RepID=A0A834IQW2_RHYFE|nr:hypothetical protein GWI33_000690 [Rhynchophorus ferrugineus]
MRGEPRFVESSIPTQFPTSAPCPRFARPKKKPLRIGGIFRHSFGFPKPARLSLRYDVDRLLLYLTVVPFSIERLSVVFIQSCFDCSSVDAEHPPSTVLVVLRVFRETRPGSRSRVREPERDQ